MTQVEPAGQAGVQADRNGNGKSMRTGLGWGLSVQPEFGRGQALGVLPAMLPEGEPYIFLSMMQQTKYQEVGQSTVQILPPNDRLYPQMTEYTLKWHITQMTDYTPK